MRVGHRGGLGLRRSYRFLSDASALTLVKKTKTAPWGMAGGDDGDAGYVSSAPGRTASSGPAWCTRPWHPTMFW